MDKTDYSYGVQRLYLELFLSDAETFIRCQNIFDPKTPQIPYMEHKTFEDVISENPEFFVQTFIGLLIELCQKPRLLMLTAKQICNQ